MNLLEDYKVYQGVDLIGGTKSTKSIQSSKVSKSGSFFVIFTVGVRKADSKRVILNILRKRGLTFGQQVKEIKRERERFRPCIIGIEDNNAQNFMVDHLRTSTDCPVVGLTTTATKWDPDTGVASLALEFENGKWELPYMNRQTIELIDVLVEELKSWPFGATTDIVMAMWIASKVITQRDKGQQQLNKHKQYLETAKQAKKPMNVYQLVANNLKR